MFGIRAPTVVSNVPFSRSKPCLVSKPLTKWMLVYLNKNEAVVKMFFNALQAEAGKLGMKVTVPGKKS